MLFLLKDLKPYPDRKIIKPLTLDNLFSCYDILAKLVVELLFPAKMTMAHASTLPRYLENLVLVVILLLKSKIFYVLGAALFPRSPVSYFPLTF